MNPPNPKSIIGGFWAIGITLAIVTVAVLLLILSQRNHGQRAEDLNSSVELLALSASNNTVEINRLSANNTTELGKLQSVATNLNGAVSEIKGVIISMMTNIDNRIAGVEGRMAGLENGLAENRAYATNFAHNVAAAVRTDIRSELLPRIAAGEATASNTMFLIQSQVSALGERLDRHEEHMKTQAVVVANIIPATLPPTNVFAIGRTQAVTMTTQPADPQRISFSTPLSPLQTAAQLVAAAEAQSLGTTNFVPFCPIKLSEYQDGMFEIPPGGVYLFSGLPNGKFVDVLKVPDADGQATNLVVLHRLTPVTNTVQIAGVQKFHVVNINLDAPAVFWVSVSDTPAPTAAPKPRRKVY